MKMHLRSRWRALRDEFLPGPGGQRRVNWISVFALILTVVGLARSAAFYVVSDRAFIGHGHWLMTMSPMPAVIHGYTASADFIKWLHITGTMEDSRSFDFTLDDRFYGGIDASEFLRLAYAEALIYPAGNRAIQILADGFCGEGALRKALDLSSPIDEIIIETPRPSSLTKELVRVKILC